MTFKVLFISEFQRAYDLMTQRGEQLSNAMSELGLAPVI